MPSVISIEMNEVNFDLIERYIALGHLPAFRDFLERYELFETESETHHPNIEPWIQWPTVYTGKTFGEHGLFRLGDVVEADHEQIWEVLEREGVTVGAISPMNAANKCRNPAFFIPDPWTVTKVTGRSDLQALYAALRQIVNENAHGGASIGKVARQILPAVLKYARVGSAPEYARILWRARRYKWARAMFLDRLLADLLFTLKTETGVGFASLFLNAAAHIQHHHLYESQVYDGPKSNPDWYSSAKRDGVDPLLEVYRTYDTILRDALALPDTRLLLTTGLSQVANPASIHQYRFIDHKASLARLGVTTGTVVPRMSRDFLIEFDDATEREAARARLEAIRCAEKPLFLVEVRPGSLFCQIVHFGDQAAFASVETPSGTVDLSGDVTLVSIENGIHRTIGFHADTMRPRRPAAAARSRFPLEQVFSRLRDATLQAA